ncbi:MAG: RidA family protein [Bacteroidota bacterium]|nr:RidA family protein [Bacteroidota bacterium]MDE2957012.1 RidA family protein [Bacteroidota bacterium]
MNRQRVSSHSPWESVVGYSRAIRAGGHVFVAGTTAVDASGKLVCVGDAYGQTRRILQIIEQALHAAGATMEEVVRTRIYVVNIARDAEAVGRAHGDVFRDIRPASSLVEVSQLMEPEMLVEIEVHAVATA